MARTRDRRRSTRGAGCRSWSAGPGSTCARRWTARLPGGVGRRSGPGSTPSWPNSAPQALHARLAGRRPRRGAGDPAQQRPAHRPRAGGHRAHRATVHRPDAGVRVRVPAVRPAGSRPRRPRRPRRATGARDDGCRTARGGARPAAASGLRASPTAGKALGYAQLLAAWTTTASWSGTSTRRSSRRCAPPAGSCTASASWFRRDPRVRWLDAAIPDLLARGAHYAGGCEVRQGPRHARTTSCCCPTSTA